MENSSTNARAISLAPGRRRNGQRLCERESFLIMIGLTKQNYARFGRFKISFSQMEIIELSPAFEGFHAWLQDPQPSFAEGFKRELSYLIE